jgi:predicted MFS family arabinose efflux permease
VSSGAPGITGCGRLARSTREKWAVVALLSAGLAMDYLARLALFSVLPLLRKELIASDVVLGAVASAFPWTYGLLSPAAGYVGDRFPRRTVLVASIGLWSLATALSGFVHTAWQLIAMRIVLAAAQVCYMPTAQACIADFHDADTRAMASGLYQAGSYVGIFLAGLPAASVATHVGWRLMLAVCGGSGLLIGVLLWAKLPAAPQRPGSLDPLKIQEALSLVRKPSLMTIAVAFSLASASYWVLFTYLPLFVYERYRLSLEAAAFQATFFVQASAMVSMPLFGAASDRWTNRHPRNRFLAAALVTALGIPALIAIGGGRHGAVLIAGLVVFGLVMAGADASWLPMLCAFTQPHQRATAYGILNTAGTIAGALAAMITALVMKRLGLGFVIASLGALYILAAAALLLAGYRFLRSDREEKRLGSES